MGSKGGHKKDWNKLRCQFLPLVDTIEREYFDKNDDGRFLVSNAAHVGDNSNAGDDSNNLYIDKKQQRQLIICMMDKYKGVDWYNTNANI